MHGNVLVTGCNGFVGRHLTEHLRSSGDTVFGIDLQPGPWAEWLPYDAIDITDLHAVLECIDEHEAKVIYHLAGVSNPRIAQEHPLDALRTNVLGSSSFFEACRKRRELRLLVIGSLEEYRKRGERELYLTEDSELDATTVYGMTKVCAELVGKSYVRHFGCHIVFTRSFNHTGPGQPPAYVLSDFAMQCAQIAARARQPLIHVGNIEVRRDFLDVADVVRAYRCLVEKGTPGAVYNVCSSECYSLRDMLVALISFTGRDDIRIVVEHDRIRSDDPMIIHGDSRRLREYTGWTQLMPIQETLRRLYEYWQKESQSR